MRHPAKTADERADELARLAKTDGDPGHRLFYLQWAEVFKRLASIGQDPDLKDLDKPRQDD